MEVELNALLADGSWLIMLSSNNIVIMSPYRVTGVL